MTDSGWGKATHDGDADLQLAWISQHVANADADVTWVNAAHLTPWQGSAAQFADQDVIGTLAAAIAAASRAAGRLVRTQSYSSSLEDRKVAIDGAATSAAEAVLSKGNFRITVAAGEGERDRSPGAQSGQVIGRLEASSREFDGIFDYVDGTALAANAEPGALALGAIGRGVRKVPDLQAFAVIGPKAAIAEFDLNIPFEDSATRSVASLASFVGRPAKTLTVLTHSLGTRPSHRTLIDRLRGLVGEVVVPPGVSVEPPYLLSLIGLSFPRIDAFVGGIGLSELSYAAALLDLMAPHFGIKFRLCSVEGPKNSPESVVLDPLLDFTSDELAIIDSYSLSPSKVYTGEDLLVHKSALAAAMFAVTQNPILGWSGASETDGQDVTGLLLLPGKEIIKIQIGYRS